MPSRKSSVKQAPAVVPPTYYRIQAKFAPDIFFPSNALEERFWERSGYENVRFTTLDDKNCIPQFISTTNNRDGEYDSNFDDFCQRMFGLPFVNIKSMWISRLGKVDYYWHWVKLIKI